MASGLVAPEPILVTGTSAGPPLSDDAGNVAAPTGLARSTDVHDARHALTRADRVRSMQW